MKGFALTGTLIAVGASVMLAGLGYIFSLSSRHNEDVKDINVELSRKGEEISAIKEAVDTIKGDNKEIRSDVKELLRRIK